MRLTGYASWDDNDVSTGEGVLHAIVLWQECRDFLWYFNLGIPSAQSGLRRTAMDEICDRSAPTPGVLTTS